MNAVKVKGRKEAIECCRLMAAVLVVFIHCQFPGAFGACMNCLARVGVPFFFMVSGYFAYGAGAPVIGRRVVSAAKLNLAATGLFVLWGMYKTHFIDYGQVGKWLADNLSAQSLSKWLVVNVNPFAGHLWYLAALLCILCGMYLYERWQDGNRNYQPLYRLGAALGAVQILLDSTAKIVGFDMPYMFCRNGLVWGFPMFCLGLFVREYQDKITEVYRLTKGRLLLLVAAGAGLSLLQWFGSGPAEMPVGTYVEVTALLLFLISAPQISGSRKWLAAMIGKFGSLSTYVYVTHLFWRDLYEAFLRDPLLGALNGNGAAEAWLYPAAVVLLTLATGVLWVGACNAVKEIGRR